MRELLGVLGCERAIGCIGDWVCVRILIHQLIYLHILISEIFSSLPVDVGQKRNDVNPWCSFVCVCLFIFRFWVCFIPIVYFLEIFL